MKPRNITITIRTTAITAALRAAVTALATEARGHFDGFCVCPHIAVFRLRHQISTVSETHEETISPKKTIQLNEGKVNIDLPSHFSSRYPDSVVTWENAELEPVKESISIERWQMIRESLLINI